MLYVDYAPIEEFLVGVCGKTEREAMYTSFREVEMLEKGKQEVMKLHWEIARWEQFMQVSISPNIKRGSKPHTPQAMLRFPWERQVMEAKVPERLSEGQKASLTEIKEMFYNKRKLS